jgi:hypothetical protein
MITVRALICVVKEASTKGADSLNFLIMNENYDGPFIRDGNKQSILGWIGDVNLSSSYDKHIFMVNRGRSELFQIFHSARLELHNAWKDSYGAVNEVLKNLFLASFHINRSMMFVYKRQPWIVHRHNLPLELATGAMEGPARRHDGVTCEWERSTRGASTEPVSWAARAGRWPARLCELSVDLV